MEEQQDGSPLCREVGDGGRIKRRIQHPLDPTTTRDRDDDDDMFVEHGDRTRDTTIETGTPSALSNVRRIVAGRVRLQVNGCDN